MTQEQGIIEPLAKFHARVTSKMRMAIPKETRTLYEINFGDFVEIIIRKLDVETKNPLKRAFAILKLSANGQVVIPKEMAQELGIEKGLIVEVLLIDVIKSEEILRIRSIPPQWAHVLKNKGFAIINENEEKALVSSKGILP